MIPASTKTVSVSTNAASMRLFRSGEMALASTKTRPVFLPRTVSAQATASCSATSGGSTENNTSHVSTRPCMSATPVMPASTMRAWLSALRPSVTVKVFAPAPAKCPASAAPISPAPRKPIFIPSLVMLPALSQPWRPVAGSSLQAEWPDGPVGRDGGPNPATGAASGD